MNRWLYLVPLMTVVVGWVVFVLIFAVRKRGGGREGPQDAPRKADAMSFWGIGLQMAGFAMVWSVGRRPFTPVVPVGVMGQWVIAAVVVVLVPVSLWVMSAAVRTLGRQWSLGARVLEGHELVMAGPYRFARHPIYLAMAMSALAVGLAYSHWVGLVVGMALVAAGTAVRVRSEERLLREQFGGAYDEYARRVPAVVPWKLGLGS
jgi:protein-S-isoprenylcysteine O-methyltransferase Ste14